MKRSHNFGIFQEDQRKSSIEGKKICWNFRKGRCRFGHKCTYAHDSDVLASIQRQTESSELSESELTARLPTETASTSKKYDDSAVISSSGMHQGVKKKRPGLSDQITPSKKAMKFFDKVYESTPCADHHCEDHLDEENAFCYKAACYETTRLIAARLNIPKENYTVAFQSRLDKKWLEPFSDEVV